MGGRTRGLVDQLGVTPNTPGLSRPTSLACFKPMLVNRCGTGAGTITRRMRGAIMMRPEVDRYHWPDSTSQRLYDPAGISRATFAFDPSASISYRIVAI